MECSGRRAAQDDDDKTGLSSGTETFVDMFCLSWMPLLILRFDPFPLTFYRGRPLDPDNSMYRGRPANVRVSSEATFTPIIQTRAARRASQSTSSVAGRRPDVSRLSKGPDVEVPEVQQPSTVEEGSLSQPPPVPVDDNESNDVGTMDSAP
jgi:hypothetical protein